MCRRPTTTVAALELFNSKLITTFSYFQQELNNARITTEVRPDRVTGGLIGVLEQRGVARTKGFEHTAKRDQAGNGLGMLPAYNSWDGLVGYRRGNWDAQVNVYNLADANFASIAVAKFLMYGGDSRKIRFTLTRTF